MENINVGTHALDRIIGSICHARKDESVNRRGSDIGDRQSSAREGDRLVLTLGPGVFIGSKLVVLHEHMVRPKSRRFSHDPNVGWL